VEAYYSNNLHLGVNFIVVTNKYFFLLKSIYFLGLLIKEQKKQKQKQKQKTKNKNKKQKTKNKKQKTKQKNKQTNKQTKKKYYIKILLCMFFHYFYIK